MSRSSQHSITSTKPCQCEKDEKIDKIFFILITFLSFRFRKSSMVPTYQKKANWKQRRGSQRGSYGCSISGGGPITPHRSSASYWLPLTHQPPFSLKEFIKLKYSPPLSSASFVTFSCSMAVIHGLLVGVSALFGPFFTLLGDTQEVQMRAPFGSSRLDCDHFDPAGKAGHSRYSVCATVWGRSQRHRLIGSQENISISSV